MNLKRFVLGVSIVGMLQGCATHLASNELGKIQGQAIEFDVAHQYRAEAPSFKVQLIAAITHGVTNGVMGNSIARDIVYVETKDFGTVGSGQKLVAELGLPHPGAIMANELKRTLAERYNMQVAPGAKYRLTISGLNWKMTSNSLAGSTLTFNSSVALTDLATNKEIASLPLCYAYGSKSLKRYSAEELKANNGAIFKEMIEFAAKDCVNQFLKTLG